MSRIKKIFYVLLLSSITSLITCCIYIFADNKSVEIIGSYFYIFNLLFVTLIEAFIISKFSNQKIMSDRQFIKILKFITIKLIMMITSLLIYLFLALCMEKIFDIVHLEIYNDVGYTIFITILAFLMYFAKILFSFSLIICVTSGLGIIASIKRSIKFALKNIKIVLCYNILFIVFLYVSNFLIKFITDMFIKVEEFDFKAIIAMFLSAMFMELVNYIILITNLKIFLMHKNDNNEKIDSINQFSQKNLENIC